MFPARAGGDDDGGAVITAETTELYTLQDVSQPRR